MGGVSRRGLRALLEVLFRPTAIRGAVFRPTVQELSAMHRVLLPSALFTQPEGAGERAARHLSHPSLDKGDVWGGRIHASSMPK